MIAMNVESERGADQRWRFTTSIGKWKGGGGQDCDVNVSDGHIESQSQCAFNKTFRKGKCTFPSAVGVEAEG